MIRDVRQKPVVVLCVAVLLSVAAGCGDGEPDTADTTAATEAGATQGSAKLDSGGTQDSGPSGTQAGGRGSGSNESNAGAQGGPPAGSGGDDSIQTYGSEASDEEKSEIVTAMRSFLNALADSDYEGVCAGTTEESRKALEQLGGAQDPAGKSCPTVLESVLISRAEETRNSAEATVTSVRVGDGNAFVIFDPSGEPTRFFTMKEEDGEWKAANISAGTPLDLSAAIAESE